jgi:DNA-binding Lrp family transcriptional regulator
MKLKDIDYEILYELMKNPKISDRKLAVKIGSTQPTVTRKRARLEREGLIKYVGIPNLEKLGYEIMAISFSKWTSHALTEMLPTKEFDKQVQLFFSKHPNVIFASTGGHGVDGMDSVSISVHKNYADYHKWVDDVKATWGKNIAKFDSHLISLKNSSIVRQITMEHLPEHIDKTRTNDIQK